MNLQAINTKEEVIDLNEFFEQFKEFTEDEELMYQTSRILKVMLRHPNQKDIMLLPTTSKCGKFFCVTDRKRTYKIYFQILDDILILTAIN